MFDSIALTIRHAEMFLKPGDVPFADWRIIVLDSFLRTRLNLGCEKHSTDRLKVTGRRFYADPSASELEMLLQSVYDTFGIQRIVYDHEGVVEIIEADGCRWLQNDGTTIYDGPSDLIGSPANP